MGWRRCASNHADQIIALGGGSAIDAAKLRRLKYESPDTNLEDLGVPFLDLRKRIAKYLDPPAKRPHLIAISTTSGTGSEVTPIAVLIDKTLGRKVTLADYSLTPDVAIVDPQFVMSMPKVLTADTGIDCLTHGLEAWVSVHVPPYPAVHAFEASRMVFQYLPVAYEHPEDEEDCSMMHNAACMAGFLQRLGRRESRLAHPFGACFDVAHGRANALLLPPVIAYNASVPSQFMSSPHQKAYLARVRNTP